MTGTPTPTPTPTLDQHPELANVARICHEINREWVAYSNGTAEPSWDEAPDWQKESAALGVLFHINNPDADDASSHNAWLAHKEAEGWKYGPIKDPEAKQHPCMLPFEALPRWQQFKDRLFRTIVRASVGE